MNAFQGWNTVHWRSLSDTALVTDTSPKTGSKRAFLDQTVTPKAAHHICWRSKRAPQSPRRLQLPPPPVIFSCRPFPAHPSLLLLRIRNILPPSLVHLISYHCLLCSLALLPLLLLLLPLQAPGDSVQQHLHTHTYCELIHRCWSQNSHCLIKLYKPATWSANDSPGPILSYSPPAKAWCIVLNV